MRSLILACRVLSRRLEKLCGKVRALYLDYGLHRVPDRMRSALQEMIDVLDQPSLVLLGYGLCGNGTVGLKSGPNALVIPRCNDCITLPGTYYLSKGWLESGSHPLKEHRELTEKYGETTASWLILEEYSGYRRIALVTGNPE